METATKRTATGGIISFFQTRVGRGILAATTLALAYVFGSWALDSGSILDYAIAFILLIIAVRETAAIVGQSLRKKT